jgi:hypothetical protein
MKKYRIATALCAAFLLTGMFSAVAYAGGDEEIPPDGSAVIIEEAPATEYPDGAAASNPFTPSGTGTVVDYATGEDGKEFYTIMTPAENVFYLVIDRQRSVENVYFLNAVTEADLLALAEIPEVIASPTAAEQPPAQETPDQPPTTPDSGQDGTMGTIILIALIVMLGGGAGWYFKIYRPKHQNGGADEYEPSSTDTDADEEDVPYNYGWDEQDAPDEDDDTPPWGEDESGGRK